MVLLPPKNTGGREGGREGEVPTLSVRPKRSMEVTRARRSFRLQSLKPSSIKALRSSCFGLKGREGGREV